MIIFQKDLAAIMISHCQNEFPNEACGILAGKEARVEKIYPMVNRDKSPETFFMAPEEQFRVIKEMRNLDLEMVGIYHSHVASEAYPSAHDVELAFYPEAAYLIVSLKEKDNPAVRSFNIREGKISEEEIKII